MKREQEEQDEREEKRRRRGCTEEEEGRSEGYAKANASLKMSSSFVAFLLDGGFLSLPACVRVNERRHREEKVREG